MERGLTRPMKNVYEVVFERDLNLKTVFAQPISSHSDLIADILSIVVNCSGLLIALYLLFSPFASCITRRQLEKHLNQELALAEVASKEDVSDAFASQRMKEQDAADDQALLPPGQEIDSVEQPGMQAPKSEKINSQAKKSGEGNGLSQTQNDRAEHLS